MADLVRSLAKIGQDITANKEISRQDIYEILKNTPGEDVSEKREGVSTFLQSLPSEIINETDAQGKTVLEKVLNDLNSYPI